MERAAQRASGNVPRIYRRDAAPDVREYLVLSIGPGDATNGKYVGIRRGASPEIEAYDVDGTVWRGTIALHRTGRSETTVGTIDDARLTFGADEPWLRVGNDEVDDDVVRFAERAAIAAPAIAAVADDAEALARRAVAERVEAEARAAEARATADVLHEELVRLREEHARAAARAADAQHAVTATRRREADALARAHVATQRRAAAEEARARDAVERMDRERDEVVRARVAARLAQQQLAPAAVAAAPVESAPPEPPAAVRTDPVADLRCSVERAERDEEQMVRALEARVVERTAAVARALAALDRHRARWSAKLLRAPDPLVTAYKAAERELNAARDELTLLRRTQRQRRLELLRAEHDAARG